MQEELFDLMEEHRIVLRPSVLPGLWVAGRFVRVYLDGKIEIDHEITADTPDAAILTAIRLLSGSS